MVRSLLDTGAASFHGEHHHVELEALGVRPAAEHVPFLIGGHGRRVVSLAGRFADIFQYTGLHHGEGGVPNGGGFGIEHVVERSRWLTEAAQQAGDRSDAIERSILVQHTHVGDGAEAALDAAVERFGMERALLESTPFVLIGSVEQVVDKLERLREQIGVNHVTIRDVDGFAPVVAALAGR